MAISTKEIDIFATNGPAQIPSPEPSVGEQYLQMMQSSAAAPATMQDYQDEAQRLSFLLPQTRRPTLYDMATDLSRGLVEQAASGRPPSVGYGLAAGFNLFSEGAKLRRQKREEQKQKLMQLAYDSIENRRAESKALAEKAGTYDFEIEIEKAKALGQGLFGNLNSVEGRAIDFLVRFRANPALKITNKAEYEGAIAYLGSKHKLITVDGNSVSVPVFDVNKLFGIQPPIVHVPVDVITEEQWRLWQFNNPGVRYYVVGDPEGRIGTVPMTMDKKNG